MEIKEATIKSTSPLMTPASNHGRAQSHQLKYKILLAILVTLTVFVLLHLGETQRTGKRPNAPYPSGRTAAKTSEEEQENRPLSVMTPAANACGLPEIQNPLVHVSGSRTYLVASYVEHRLDQPQIRTIAVVKRDEQLRYVCQFCCGEQLKESNGMYEIHSDHFGFRHGTADILCSIPKECSTPSHVAIYKRPLGDEKPPFIPIHNQHEAKSFSYQFTVCISVMYDYANILQLVQTMEMFRLLGAQHVAIYKSSCNAATQRVLDYYVKTGFVEIIPWPITRYINVSRGWQPSVSPGDMHYFGQIAALNDCVYRFMYRTQYVVLQDLDEIIVPLTVDSWTELLPLLEKKHGGFASFEFENHVFRNTLSGRHAALRPKDWAGVPGVDILDHVWREPNDPTAFNNFKVIVNPRTVYSTTVHGLLSADSHAVRVDRTVARLYHTRVPWRHDVTNDQLIKDERLWDYAPRLIPAVSDVLNKTFSK